jgi:hypothetical protein
MATAAMRCLRSIQKEDVVDSAPRQASSCAEAFDVLGVDEEGQHPFLDLAGFAFSTLRTSRHGRLESLPRGQQRQLRRNR